MKNVKKILFLITIGIIFAVSSPAQQAGQTKKLYQNIEVQQFTIKENVEFPAENIEKLTNSVVNALRKSKRFNEITLASAAAQDHLNNSATENKAAEETSPADAADGASTVSKLRVSGEIIKYVKGNRAVRYMVGLGMGATKIIANIKFTDAETGELVWEQTVDGDVTWGFFGGDSDSAKNGVASEIVKIAKKNFTDGKKKK